MRKHGERTICFGFFLIWLMNLFLNIFQTFLNFTIKPISGTCKENVSKWRITNGWINLKMFLKRLLRDKIIKNAWRGGNFLRIWTWWHLIQLLFFTSTESTPLSSYNNQMANLFWVRMKINPGIILLLQSAEMENEKLSS